MTRRIYNNRFAQRVPVNQFDFPLDHSRQPYCETEGERFTERGAKDMRMDCENRKIFDQNIEQEDGAQFSGSISTIQFVAVIFALLGFTLLIWHFCELIAGVRFLIDVNKGIIASIFLFLFLGLSRIPK